mmetsp:Transcript_90916/g.245681  ORF Transcript_90916/g.245681 Transcript_90916/m.245681 type:complete len:618 (-) Transcript_90916:54-1907(-)
MDVTLPPTCFQCGADEAEFACSRCRKVRFCGPACQRGAWQRHQPDCRAPAALAATSSASASAAESAQQVSWAPPKVSAVASSAAAPWVDGSNRLQQALQVTVYPNVGARHGEVQVHLDAGTDFQGVREAIATAVLGMQALESVAAVRLFGLPRAGGSGPEAGGRELRSVEDLLRELSHTDGGLVASAGAPLRRRASQQPADVPALAGAPRRYDATLVGGEVLRVDGTDPELPALLRCPVPIVVSGSGMLGEAPSLWNFEYLERHISDVDNFFVLRSPATSRGRFAYYDMGPQKNPCGYPVTRTNERVEMRFPAFRKEASKVRQKKRAGKQVDSVYLQSALLHRDEQEEGPPRPVGSFGISCAVQVAKDIQKFRWDWLREQMSGRHVQTCQLFCGQEGDFSPCHYDPQDNLFGQVRGYKRVLLFHPRHLASLYPWPVNHPQDRQSRVDFDAPDLKTFPKFADLQGQGLEVVLGPGDVLHLPPGWWHHIEMLPSEPHGEVVSINFWYPAPKWFYGDPNLGESSLAWDRPLFGVKRVLFERCVEELLSQLAGPDKVPSILRQLLNGNMSAADDRSRQAFAAVKTFVGTVFPDAADQKELISEILDGRFAGLVSSVGSGGG